MGKFDDSETLGVYYLGRTGRPSDEPAGRELLLYDSSDLTTHAVWVGMTGSGKTGLCIGLLEERLIDGIPTRIAVKLVALARPLFLERQSGTADAGLDVSETAAWLV